MTVQISLSIITGVDIMPKFSVIVPVYNVEEYLDECVKSVIEQTFTDWELILVDDGSSDNSYKICCSYAENDARIKAIHQENTGASGARNNGISNAAGEYILFLDSDDFYNKNICLEIISNKLDEAGSDILVFGCTDFNMMTGKSIVSRTGYNLELIDKNNYRDTMHYLLSNKMIPGGPTIFAFRRDIVIQNDIRFKQGIQDEDYDFVLSVFLNSKSVTAIDDPFYSYRHGRAESVTGSGNILMIRGIDYTVNKWIPICLDMKDEILRKDYLNYIAFIYTTGFVVTGRMKGETKKESINLMKKHTDVLKYGYWRKTRITKLAVKLMGMNLFSTLSAIYFKKTHIQ